MKIAHLSDTHNLHNEVKLLPEADVVVHSGDFTNYGTDDEILDFINWFAALPYRHKIFVCGNHDFNLWDADNIEDLPRNVHFLQDRAVVIDGVKFYGAGFMHYACRIPSNMQVLITHEPPRGILDREDSCGIGEYGSDEICRQVFDLPALRLHLFGHSHGNYGQKTEQGIIFSNAALADDFGNIVHPPRVIEI